MLKGIIFGLIVLLAVSACTVSGTPTPELANAPSATVLTADDYLSLGNSIQSGQRVQFRGLVLTSQDLSSTIRGIVIPIGKYVIDFEGTGNIVIVFSKQMVSPDTQVVIDAAYDKLAVISTPSELLDSPGFDKSIRPPSGLITAHIFNGATLHEAK